MALAESSSLNQALTAAAMLALVRGVQSVFTKFEVVHVGVKVGLKVGDVVGDAVGDVVGDEVGDAVGSRVGERVGIAVGLNVGDAVGLNVGPELPPESQSPPSKLYWEHRRLRPRSASSPSQEPSPSQLRSASLKETPEQSTLLSLGIAQSSSVLLPLVVVPPMVPPLMQ